MSKKFILIFLSSIFLLSAKLDENKDLIAPENKTIWLQRDSVMAKDYLVVSGHELASEAGQKIIEKGGSAIDAAIAVQMVLGLVEPHASGIGGGGFLLYYDAKTKKSSFYDGRESAPNDIPDDVFTDENGNKKGYYEALRGGTSVGVPGVLKMLDAAHKDHGKLSWSELFIDAIYLAKSGFFVSERLNKLINQVAHADDFSPMREYFQDGDLQAKTEGTLVTNLQLSNTLEKIADGGSQVFYEGIIADNIVEVVRNSFVNPGYLTKKDFKKYKAVQGDLICIYYREYKICTMPMPSSGGVAILQALGILENFDLSQLEVNSPEAIHVLSEAMRLAYVDRNFYAADSNFVNVPVDAMLDKEYLKKRSFMINVDSSLIDVKPGKFSDQKVSYIKNPYEGNSTTHMSIVDKEGNAVSYTSSIEYSFGSGLMVDGFILNNQLTDFSFVSELDGVQIANRIEPNKKPRSSMSPIFVFAEDGQLIMVVGSPGGSRIIAYVLKTIVAVLDWRIDVNSAAALPNFVKMEEYLELERGTEIEPLAKELKEKGHKVKISDLTSGVNAIYIDPARNLHGAADPRREGVAIGR